jgi:hypothetical protein
MINLILPIRLFIFSLCLVQLISCKQVGDKSPALDESSIETPSDKMNVDSVNANSLEVAVSNNDVKGNPDSAELKSKSSKDNITVSVFKNTKTEGFGYDIIMDGKPYIHQPNIPALPGNKGFQSEEMASRVADLVIFKIRNNIMPPTVEVKELDSLGIR